MHPPKNIHTYMYMYYLTHCMYNLCMYRTCGYSVYTSMHAHTHAHTHSCIHTCTHNTHTQHTHTQTRTHNTHTCKHAHTYIHTHTKNHTHTCKMYTYAGRDFRAFSRASKTARFFRLQTKQQWGTSHTTHVSIHIHSSSRHAGPL